MTRYASEGRLILIYAKRVMTCSVQFLPLLVEAFKQTPIGDPMLKDTLMGAQVTKAHFDRIMGYIAKGKEEGATVATGGKRHGTKGYFIEPTLLTDVSRENTAGREEIFGPVGQFTRRVSLVS